MLLDDEKIAQILANIHKLPAAQQKKTLKLVQELQKRQNRGLAQTSFLDFVKQMWPEFVIGRHHVIMAEKFEAVARGEIKRLAISLPPRHTKSEFASILLPAWFLGNYPSKKKLARV